MTFKLLESLVFGCSTLMRKDGVLGVYFRLPISFALKEIIVNGGLLYAFLSKFKPIYF